MDVRHYAFLPGQPFAAVRNREYFWGMPKRGLAFLLANVMFWQPIWAQADGIVVATPGTSLGQAGNGVPIIQIATPNGSGLSHNQFHDYNVGTQGVILNNVANQTGATQLGGIIVGNPNLTNRIAAQTILNEVVGSNPSQLRGYTEVAGQSARVIVANPYGISCNGCGFINTPRVTLTTGKPVLDNGRLDRFRVDQGSVAIDGAGLNANNVDRFEIITRSAKINAEIQANNLTIIAGRNDVNADDLNATTRVDDGSGKPGLAIDSSALGGMYAGAIKLVGTEAGVGVRLDGNLAASGGDIRLDANGQLSLAQTSATGAVNVKAASLDARGPVYAGTAVNVQTQGNLTNQQTLAARDNITLSAGGVLTNNGIIEAGVNADTSRNASGDVNLNAQNLNNTGKSVVASRNLTVNTSQTLNNQGGTLSAAQTANITVGTLDNQNNGRVLSSGALNVTANQVFNISGAINSTGNLTGMIGQLNNSDGEISSAGITRVNAVTLNNRSGQVLGDLGLNIDLSGALDNRDGVLGSGKSVDLKAASLDNRGGKVTGKDTLTVSSDSADNRGGVIQADKQLKLQIGQLDNRDKGVISGKAGIVYDGTRLDNSGGLLSAVGPVTLNAAKVQNAAGRIASQSDLTATIGLLQQQGGALVAEGNLSLTGTTLDNSNGGLVGTTKALTLKVDDIDNRAGELSSSLLLNIKGQRLNNSGGGKVLAATDLKLAVAKLINQNKGLIAAKGATTLTGTTLDNTGGTFNSLKGLVVTLDDALLNGQGLISSEGTLTVNAASLDNSAGSLSSAGALSVISRGALLNVGGSISTDATLTLDSAGLDNSQKGLISGKDTTRVVTGSVDNSQGGRLISGTALDLTAKQVNNAAGQIASQQALTASVTGLDQQGGELFSQTSLSLDLNNGQLNNQSGLINAPLLVLKNLKGVYNQGGEISSAEAFTLTAQSLDNSNGKLLSNQGLTLRIANALDNVKGLIGAASLDARAASLNNSGGSLTSRGDLELTVDGLLRNDAKGLINAAQLLKVGSAEFNNQSGTVLGVSAVILNAMALNNRDSGLISSQGNLTLTATDLDSSNDGEVSAKGDIDLTLTSLTQNGGRLFGDKAVTLELTNGDLDNRNGLLTAKGPLTLKRLRDLKNQNGEVSSNLGFDVIARALDNSAGRLISSQLLTVNGTSLVNQKGLISGWQGLTVNGTSLDNRDSGTLSSRNGDVAVDLKGVLLNSNAGALVGQGSLSVKASTLDNSNKGILSSAAGQTLTLTSLNNNQGGLIDSGAALDITTGAWTNAGGTINAQEAINATATGLNNTAGSIAGNGAITLDLPGALTNTSGKLAGAGPVLIKRVTDLANQNGQFASQSTLTLLTGSLDNSNNGTLAAKDALQITASGAVRNDTNGLIYSQNAGLNVKAASLANGKGTIQSQKGLTLDVSGDLDNQSGKVIAQNGLVKIDAANIDNRGGVLSSIKGALEARTVGVLRNGYDLNNNRRGGIIQGQGMTLTALAGLDNNGGRISAQATDTSITTAALDNRNGVLYAKGLVGVTGASLDNGNGQIAGNRIDLSFGGALNNRAGIVESDTTLTVKAASVDNQTGQLRSLGGTNKTSFQIGGLLDNRNGVLETANTDLTLAVGSFLNAGGKLNHVGRGRFDISTANVIGAGGSITTAGTLDLNADTWTNSSVIQAGRLNVNVGNFSQTASGQLLASNYLQARGGNWTNDGLIASDGVVDMRLGGSYSGNGRLSSLGGLTLTAAQLNLNAASSIAGGGDSIVKIGGQLTNAGRLTSNADLTVEAGSLINTGTLGAAQNLDLKTPSLLNDRGLIFSGADMTLSVGNFTNQNGDLYGLGNVVVKGFGGAAQATQVSNISGSMESGGTFTLNAGSFANRTSGDDGTQNFGLTRTLVSGFLAVQCGDCSGDHYDVNYIAREVFEGGQDSDTTASALLTAGGDFVFNGGDFLNSKSTVSATGNITINANNLKNIGAVSGSIERTRIYRTGSVTDGTVARFMPQVVAYNQRNNPDFPNLYYVDGSGGFSLGTAFSVTDREPGHDGGLLELVVVKDTVTNKAVTNTLSGYSYGSTSPQSQYDRNNLVELPTGLQNYTLVSDIETARDGGSVSAGRNAVIQAGGNVSITAAQDLQNSVIHQDYGSTGGTNKVADTKASGTGTTVIRLNSQLPPDLAQQQVNPLTLPGFSLPTGENGLFRLSTQDMSDLAPVAGTLHPPGWTVGAVSSSDHAVLPVRRTPTVATDVASTIDVSVKLDGSTADAHTKAFQSEIGIRPVTRVTGLPDVKAPVNGHKYLIETNPVLTNLKQFMSSDYLLSNLGYNPDTSAKRLGDGLFEQRLIQQSIVARTGQRFIDGHTSDEAMFKYLMNNAIASKDALNLSVGVSLTSQQVAALTHDIVWLEEHEVNGEKVLVPVLYLAQAEGRLGPTGALIAGNDITLIAGQNLDNVGMLRATHNLSATAGKDLVNSGLIQAGNRLDVLAGNDVTNKSGGILAGRDVSVNAIMGDVLNERTITSQDKKTRFGTQHHDFADSAARIEATNDLTMGAGRDVKNIGSVIFSGRDTRIDAGRDVNMVSLQQESSNTNGTHRSSVTQFSSNVDAGRDIAVNAGRDFTAIASQISAERNVALAAGEDMTISSGANETHSYYKSKKVTAQEDHVKQIASTISAGGDVAMSAGNDMALISSRISAGDEAYLVAGNNLELLAAQDSDYSLYDKKKKGSWGKKQTRHDELTKVTNIGSEITTGGDLTLLSGGDQRYQVAKLESGDDLTLQSGGSITFEGVKDLSQESHTKSDTSLAWNSMKGKGHTDKTLRQSQLVAQGDLVIKAVDGLNIDIKQINQKSVSQTIDAMVQADPQLAWLKEAEKRGDVDWRLIKETHESFKYSNSSLGQGAMLAIIIIVTVLTAGTGTAATVGATAGSAASGAAAAAGASAATVASVGAAASAAATASFSAAVAQTAVSAINNKGDLGGTFKDAFSSESLKGYVLAGITAGIASKFGFTPTDLKFDLASAQTVGIKTAADALAKTAIMGGSLKDNLAESALGTGISVAGAIGANKIGDVTLFENGKLTKVAMHAALGGLMAEAMGGDFRTGALAAGANEAVVDFLADKLLPVGVDRNSLEYQQGVSKLLAASQLVGVLTAAVTGGDASSAAAVTANATQYNNLDHPSAERLLKELQGCRATEGCTAQNIREIVAQYEDLSTKRSMAINACDSRACVESIQKSAVSLKAPVAKDLMDFLRRNISYDMAGLLTGNPGLIAVPSQGVDGWGALFTSDKQMAFAKNLKEGWLTPAELAGVDQWVKETSWLDRAAGQQLSLSERAKLMTELQMTAGILLIGKSPPPSTSIEFGKKFTRNSSGQIEAQTTPAEAIKMLESNGYTKSFSKDGTVSILVKGDRTYRFYPKSTSTNEPTASLDIAGIKKTIVKIRLKGE